MQAAEPAPWVTRLGRVSSREGERGRYGAGPIRRKVTSRRNSPMMVM